MPPPVARGEGRDPREPMTAEHLVSLLDAIEREGINIWLDGGWGVDALLGEQTRDYDDVDFVAAVEDAERVIAALSVVGYRVDGDPSAHFVMRDDAGRQVDTHMVRFTLEGDGLYRMETGEIWPYPAVGFTGRGQILCHSGYDLDEVDLQDLQSLRERFSLPEPAAS